MKILYLFFLLIVINGLSAQIVPEVYLMAKNADVLGIIEKLKSKTALSDDDNESITLLDDKRQDLDVMKKIALNDYIGIKGENIIIMFKDAGGNYVKLSSARINSIDIYGKRENHVPNLNAFYHGIELAIALNSDPKNMETVEIKININDNLNNSVDFNFYMKYLNVLQPYGSTPIGLWFPTGMFGSSLETTETGLTFNPMPVGFALGFKVNVNEKLYFGFSGSVAYTITRLSGEGSGFSLSTISGGPLIDINDYLHFGMSWPFTLKSEESISLKPIYFFGFGVRLADLIKNMKK